MYLDDKITYEEYSHLRELVGWHKVSKRQFDIGQSKGLFMVVLREETQDNRCIGLARASGDGGYYLMLTDVIVHPDFQGRGYGRKLLEAFMQYVDENTMQGETTMLLLASAQGKEGFYEKFGFKKRPHDNFGYGMSQWITKD